MRSARPGISLHPLPVFKLLGDLSVDTGTWFRHVGKKIESWIHTNKAFDPDAQEERMDNELATQIFELDRCIECGCCVAACGTGAHARGLYRGHGHQPYGPFLY